MRFHKIAELPKLNKETRERHHYAEIEVVNEALRELLAQLYAERGGYLNRDKAHVALKILYRLEEHHKQARDGRPDYPPFSWEMVRHFAGTAPFSYTEYSTPHLGSGGLGLSSNSGVSAEAPIPAPAKPQEEDST